MSIYLLISIPIISALIGWITNFLAVKMIFHPYKEISILGVKVQGLLPKRKGDLAVKIGETVEKELFSHADIQKAVDTPAFHKEVTDTVLVAVERTINERLASNPLIAMFLTGATANPVKEMLAEEVEKQVPEFMGKMFERLESEIDVKELVQQKINDFDMQKLEDIIYSIASKELKAIEVFGAILGFIVGCAQLGLIALLA